MTIVLRRDDQEELADMLEEALVPPFKIIYEEKA
jgi:hypothetical protein